MGVNILILILLLIWNHLVSICMAGCAIKPDGNGHVDIPSTWTSIANDAFNDCSELLSVTIPDSIMSIGSSAFQDCSALKNVTIGDRVTSIGYMAFSYCLKLQSMTIGNSVTSIGNFAFYYCSALQSVTIGENVTSIGNSAFRDCGALLSVTIPDSVTSIVDQTFRRCNALQSVTIPDSVTSIGNYAFYSCSALQSVTIPDSVTSIGSYAFSSCSTLQNVTIGDSVTSIGSSAFSFCSTLQFVTIPDSVTSIGSNAFSSCSALQNVTIGDSVTSIGNYAFEYCSALQSVTIGESITSIGSNAFSSCSTLQFVTIPDSVTSIGNQAFESCFALQSVTIGSNTSISIGNSAFRYCSNLIFVSFGTISKVSIYTSAFEGCEKLEYFYFNKSLTTLSGLPIEYSDNYYCQNGVCGCSKGYGNVHDNSSSLYRCEKCREGKTSGGRVGQCENCDVGSYASQNASQVCTLCPKGRYGIMKGGTSRDMACKNCSVGSFAQADGSQECFLCPAGTHCTTTGLDIYTPCLAGRYNSYSNQTECSNCPAGSYQPSEGSAICELCNQGKYLDTIGSSHDSPCIKCPIGKYGNTKGLEECLQCPDGQYQDALGATICKSCKDLGKIMTNNADFTGCEVDKSLLNKELVVLMFEKGVALSTSFSVSAVFVLICGFMQMKKEGAKDNIGQLDRVQVFIKSALPGFSFGSELFLIFAMWKEAPLIARIMLACRLFFPLLLIYILCVVFSSDRVKDRLTYFTPNARLWGTHMDLDFAREILPVVAVMIILCIGDITLIQMLPWKKSVFYKESKGFPSISMMILCLSVKTTQSIVSVICQISYLAANSTLDDPTTSPQAKALSGLNIAVSMMTVIMGVVMLFLKDSLLKSVKRKSIVNLTKKIELSNDIDYTDNPLHNADQVSNKPTQESEDVSVKVLKEENRGLKEDNIDNQGQIEEKDIQIEELKGENEGLKEENAKQKNQIEEKDSQIEELLNTIEDMKKKSNVEL